MIATMLTLLFLAVFSAVVVSVITLSGNIGLQEEQGFQALYIAEGGLQYSPLVYNFPNYMTPAAVNLGIGSFTTSVPQLTAAVNNAQTTISVTSTDGFQLAPDNQYWVMIGPTTNPLTTSDVVEKISFTAKTATTFTAGTRGRESSVPANHSVNTAVMLYTWYPAIIADLSGSTGLDTTICVDSVALFPASGFIKIVENNENNSEDILYTGVGTSPAVCGAGCNACFTGCLRGVYSGGTGTNHAPPKLVMMAEISILTTSTGVVTGPGSGVIFTDDVQRRVQAAIMPLE
jgi:hypothetical protein